jgi:hypothetical protein
LCFLGVYKRETDRWGLLTTYTLIRCCLFFFPFKDFFCLIEGGILNGNCHGLAKLHG